MIEIVPSILSAHFARLHEEIAQVEKAGVRLVHIDVMDGHFVPNITVGPPVVASIRKITQLKLDVHLMVSEPDKFIPAFLKAGADHISVHQEACVHLDRTLNSIREGGAGAGVVLNPATPLGTIEEVLELVDHVLLMSVNPGFGGQRLIPSVLRKASRLRAMRNELGLDFAIEVDGGVNLDNLAMVIRAGFDWIVAGSAVFDSPDPAATVGRMQQIAREATLVRV